MFRLNAGARAPQVGRPCRWVLPVPLALALLLAGCAGDPPPFAADGDSSGSGGSSAELPDTDEPAPVPGPEALWLDDFEDGDDLGLVPGSSWWAYGDEGSGGASRIDSPTGAIVPLGVGPSSSRSLRVEYSFEQDQSTIQPYVGLTLGFAAPLDVTGHEGVAYAYRGDAHELRFETPEVTDYDWFALQLPASSEWKLVELYIEDLRQAGWGQEALRDFSAVQAVSFQMRGSSGESGSLELDDLRLLPILEPSGPPELERHEPEPPVKVTIGSLAITHPLAALSASALDRGYNLTNWLEQGEFDGFGSYDEGFVEGLADAGFRGLRLPIDLDRYVTLESGGYEAAPALWVVLDAFDEWTADHGLSLTIDYHQYDGDFDPDNPAKLALMAGAWGLVAEHFAGSARDDLFFELLNEPELSASAHRGPTQDEWTEIAQGFIDAIRAHDADVPIIFGDVKWYDIDELVEREPLDDERIIYAIHSYDPFLFTHQGATWTGLGTAHDIPFPYSPERWGDYYRDLGLSVDTNESWHLSLAQNYHIAGTYEALYNRIAEAKAWAVEHQVPVICNEFGALDRTSRVADRLAYYETVTRVFGELEVPWQLWFMVMDPDTGAVDPDLAEALGLAP